MIERAIVALVATVMGVASVGYINAAMQEMNNRGIRLKDAAIAIIGPGLVGFIFPHNLIAMVICAIAILAGSFFANFETGDVAMAWLILAILFGVGILWSVVVSWGKDPTPNFQSLWWLAVSIGTIAVIGCRRFIRAKALGVEAKKEEKNEE